MSSKSMRLKARINHYAKNNKIPAQVVLQNYMFERFLERLSMSEYQDKFVIKGGILIASIVGLDTRATMDLDTTLRNLALTEEKIFEALKSISALDLNDDVTFDLISVSPIRKDDLYGGFCVRMNAYFDAIVTPLSVDVSTGDVITPDAVPYEFSGIFDESIRIKLWGYNVETIMAEKIETILNRSTFSTRPRDYYDVYILSSTQVIDKSLFLKALTATSEHRGSLSEILDHESILLRITESDDLREQWLKYQNKFYYAKDIQFEQIIEVLYDLLKP